MPDEENNENEKKSVLEGMEFHETELRVPNENPTFRLVSETSNLDESKKVEITLKDGATTFLVGKLDPEMKNLSCDGCHEVKAYVIVDGALQDLTRWTMPEMSAAKKPCETADNEFNAVEALLYGEASAN